MALWLGYRIPATQSRRLEVMGTGTGMGLGIPWVMVVIGRQGAVTG